MFWIPFLVIPFYLFIVLPQRRQSQAASSMHARIVAGDEIITTSGIYGTIVRLEDETADVEIAPAIVITIARRAIGRLVADMPIPQPQSLPEPPNGSDHSGEEG